MSDEERVKRFVIDRYSLPDKYPTHRHRPEFWEALGRCVATFGYLEEVLARATFSLMATKPYNEGEIEQAYATWLSKLERALTDPFSDLIRNFGNAVRNNPMATISDLDELLDDLQKASVLRNVICHGSWRAPDADGASIPFFVNRRRKEVFETAMDSQFLMQLQRNTANLVCAVMDTVTRMGWQFPGSNGPGKVIW